MTIALALTALTVIVSVLSGALALLHYEQDPGEENDGEPAVDAAPRRPPARAYGKVLEEGSYRQEAVVAPGLSRERQPFAEQKKSLLI